MLNHYKQLENNHLEIVLAGVGLLLQQGDFISEDLLWSAII